MRSKLLLPIAFVVVLVILIFAGLYMGRQSGNETSPPPITAASAMPSAAPAAPDATTSAAPADSGVPAVTGSPSAMASAAPAIAPSGAAAPSGMTNVPPSNTQPDLAVDSSGLSKATVDVMTTKGLIKFKFYPQDAPNTVNRIIQLINQGFYNGLTFHRVVPGFVIQGGDPLGNGTGGSGQKLKAEFNNRHHVEGTVAMARAADPDSADSQFYISLGTLPHLDRSYTVFGQVTEGMDVARKIAIGDKMVYLRIE